MGEEIVERRVRLHELSDEQMSAHLALTEATRAFNLAAATTTVEPEQLLAAAAKLHELTEELGAQRTRRIVRFAFEEPARKVRAGEGVRINHLNPGQLGMDIEFEGDFVAAAASGDLVGLGASTVVTVGSLNEGPPECVHGGQVAYLMDCILGILVQSTGVPAVTGQLETVYRRPSPLDRPLRLWSRIESRQGRKITVVGGMECDGEQTVETSGIFIEVAPPTQGIGAEA